MLSYQFLLKLLPITALVFVSAVQAATTSNVNSQPSQRVDSADQALDQLRILQKRLGGTSNLSSTTGPTEAAARPSALESTVPPTRRTQKSNQVPQQPQQQQQTQAAQMGGTQDNEVVMQAAFDGVEQQLFPLSPDQLIELKQMYKTHQFAKESPVGTPPKPTATSQFVNLSPGSTPPVIRLSQGFVSSLVFLDSTGAPWPISAYDLGDPNAFSIQWDKSSNTLMIQAKSLYTYGNLAVRLKDLNTPVMLTLIPGQKAVDYRVDMRVQGYGPNATNLPLGEGLPSAANDVLLHVLDGVPPNGSSRLTVSGGDARAWLLRDKMFVRTNLTILSPGWVSSMTSADGMHAYEMQKTPVLLVSWHGKVMQLKVEGL